MKLSQETILIAVFAVAFVALAVAFVRNERKL